MVGGHWVFQEILHRYVAIDRRDAIRPVFEILSDLVEEVYTKGISVELEREEKIIARLTPAELSLTLTVEKLNEFLRSLPSLDDDAEAFARDICAIRTQFPAEKIPWD